ncbi:MAG: signal peptidase II [Betaproteobacteria bacterium]|nr:signal peptidase II [Betaproteobacteria bacterium]
MRKALPWFALAAGVAVVDQLTKWLLQTLLHPGERIPVTGFFNLVLAFNKGAAFSLLARAPGWQSPLFAGIAVAAIVVVSVLLVRSPERRVLCAGLALILGGALGNLIDRLRYGHVVDFLDFHALGWHWPAFNAADSAITLGAGLVILDSFLHDRGDGRS